MYTCIIVQKYLIFEINNKLLFKLSLFSCFQVSGFAFAGYAAGIAAYLALHNVDISLPTTLAHVPFIPGS